MPTTILGGECCLPIARTTAKSSLNAGRARLPPSREARKRISPRTIGSAGASPSRKKSTLQFYWEFYFDIAA